MASHIVLFGAGKSATVLIDYLIDSAKQMDWRVTIADANQTLIEQKIGGRNRAEAHILDILDAEKRGALIASSDVVISMMPPALHILIARDCLTYRKHLLTASYVDDAIKDLDAEAREKGLLFLCEMGLDPGIDHMSAMKLLDDIREQGGKITSFKSHCGGLVAPENDDNPWRYKISWNPRNVVLAGKAGAIYMENGEKIQKSYTQLFGEQQHVGIEGDLSIQLSYYPNRNSLSYMDTYQLGGINTFLRTTLRYPEFMSGWKNLIDLKLTDETPIYETAGLSLHDFFEQHLSQFHLEGWLDEYLQEKFFQTNHVIEAILAQWDELPLNIEQQEKRLSLVRRAKLAMASNLHQANLLLKQLVFLGLNDTDTMINRGLCSAADVLQFILETKWVLRDGEKDMIVMLHEIEYEKEGKSHVVQSSLVVKGDDSLHTAMAKTVGLPLGIATTLLLNGKFNDQGVAIPVSKAIYLPVLEALKKYGIAFVDRTT